MPLLLDKRKDLAVQGIAVVDLPAGPGQGTVTRLIHAPGGEIHAVLGLRLLLPVIHHGLHFLVPQERTVQAGKLAAVGIVEHIAVAEELLSAGGAERGHGVLARGDAEADTAREVGLDEARHHVHAGTLGGDNHMDAAGAGQLRETDDAGLHVLAALQHEVSELVDDDGDIGHGLEVREIRGKLALQGREPLVVARNVLGVEP